MAHRGRRTAKKAVASHQRRTLWIAAAVLALVALAAAAALALRGGADEVGGGGGAHFPDVHGLAVARDDPSALYVATHVGLVRGSADGEGGWTWADVGASKDDFMGFSAHPSDPDVFWASGHPHDATASHPNLGLRKSVDRGQTWTTIGAPGADFHAMAVSPADPDVMWGYYAQRLHASRDGGVTWQAVEGSAPRVLGLAGHPEEAEVAYAGTPEGVRRTDDGGRTWSGPLSQGAAIGVAVAPTAPGTLYAATGAGLLRSDDAGRSWEPLGLRPDGQLAHVTVSPHDPQAVYAATGNAWVYESRDGGATWRAIHAPPGS